MIKSRYPAFPYIAFMAIFIIVPLIMVAYFAFTTSSGEFTMQNIIRVGDYVPVIVKSLFLAFVATATPLGLNTVVFPEAYGGNPKTGASMAMISHTLCVITIPLLYSLMVLIFGEPVIA